MSDFDRELDATQEHSLDVLIESICKEFENAIRAGETPEVESYLGRVPVAERKKLTQDLKLLEAEILDADLQNSDSQAHHENAATLPPSDSTLDDRTRLHSTKPQDSNTDGKQGSNASPGQPTQIGRYQLLKQIGEGGMGAVWKAQQEHPVRRLVAVKLIRAEICSAEGIARFEAERQALAMMDHPSIAKILDADTTESGSPYLVMELVDGVPLSAYCDRQKLGIRERLELFLPICAAVQHAHQKGILHRDLKPANVLVGEYDGKAVPKVIDFGLVKTLEPEQKLTDKTLVTEFGRIVGTVHYMSPEQSMMSDGAVDTRTDIYALGVMLYELLVGSTPIPINKLKGLSLVEVLDCIRELDPPRPSDRLDSLDIETKDKVGMRRDIAASRLAQQLRGELDWVTLKAIEKDPERRYESASELANDIQRYLANEPVTARSPTLAYQAQKFVQKHRLVVAAGTAIAIAMLLGMIGTTFGMLSATKSAKSEKVARLKAENAEQEAKEQTRIANDEKAAAIEAKTAAQVSEKRSRDSLGILKESFMSASPRLGATTKTTADDVLMFAWNATKESDLDNKGKASILGTLSEAFLHLGDLDAALATAQRSLEISEEFDQADADVLTAMHLAGQTYSRLEQHEEAVNVYKDLISRCQAELGPEDRYTLAAEQALGIAYSDMKEFSSAIEILKAVQKTADREFGHASEFANNNRHQLGMTYRLAKRYRDSIRVFEELLRYQKQAAVPNQEEIMITTHELGSVYRVTKQHDKAIENYLVAADYFRTKYGKLNFNFLTIQSNLSDLYWATGQKEKSISLLAKSVKDYETKYGASHSETLATKYQLATKYRMADKLGLAYATYFEIAEIRKKKLGDDHSKTRETNEGLAATFLLVFESEDTVNQFEKILAAQRKKFGWDDNSSLSIIAQQGVYFWKRKQFNQAIIVFSALEKYFDQTLGPNHPETLNAKVNLAVNYRDSGKLEKAIALFEEAYQAAAPANRDAWIVSNLRKSYLANNQMSDFKSVVEDTLDELEQSDDPESQLAMIKELNSRSLDAMSVGEYTLAQNWLKEAIEVSEEYNPKLLLSSQLQSTLGEALLGLQKYQLAQKQMVAGYKAMAARPETAEKQAEFPKVLNRLIKLARARKNKDDEAKWRKELNQYLNSLEPSKPRNSEIQL